MTTTFNFDRTKANLILPNTLNTIEEGILLRDYWVGSQFEFLAQRGGADDTGKWGELFLYQLMSTLTYFEVEWGGDKNARGDGTYDLWFILDDKKTRIEVKASRYGKSESWQHENIIRTGDPCDKLVFIDFEYSTVWITILDCKNELYFDMKHPIFGTKPSLRDEETSGSRNDKYKWDFRKLQVERGVAGSLTYCHDICEPDFEQLSEFLITKLSA